MSRATARALAGACHPGPVVAVTGATALYALGLRRRAPETIGLTAAVLAGQLAIGWQNDALDVSRDRSSGRDDKPAARGEVTSASLAAAAALAGTACVPLSLRLGRRAGTAHLLAVAAGAAYNLGLRSTAASIAPYLTAFGLLPAVIHLAGEDGMPPPPFVVVASALLGGGAHVANVLPDLEADAAHGIVGLPHRLGPRGALGLMAGLLLGATAVLGRSAPGPPGLRRAAVATSLATTTATLVLAGRGRQADARRSRAAFRLVCASALAEVAWLLLAARAGSVTPER